MDGGASWGAELVRAAPRIRRYTRCGDRCQVRESTLEDGRYTCCRGHEGCGTGFGRAVSDPTAPYSQLDVEQEASSGWAHTTGSGEGEPEYA
jgi:hypothetical protein